MACFLVPAGEAVVMTIVQKTVDKKKIEKLKLKWLNAMLWGGVLLLAVEHIWHGEVVPWPPFLSAMADPADVGPMLYEMATIGTAMAVVVTLMWGVLVVLASILSQKVAGKERAAA